MSPRPRQTSDIAILQAAFRAIARLGPSALTLADVAAEAGLSAASLVQRFGSKRALLLAAAADAASGHVYIFEELRRRHRSPVAALLGLADGLSVMGDTPEAVAHSLAFLQIDLTDPEFREHARAGSRGMHAGISALVRDAVAAGELVRVPVDRFAHAIHAVLYGSMLDWAIHGTGTMTAWVRRDLKTVIDGRRK